jgi:hypothetical protein
VDTRSRVEATGLARSLGARNGTLGRKGRRRQSTLFIPWRRGEDGVEGGVRSALPHNGREEGGPFDDRDPGVVATDDMSMTRRRRVRQRMWEQGNPKREGTDGSAIATVPSNS